ncbi:PKD-like domain-containing protein [Flavobacterium proteolyticum]|uniref:T9SS type B sorting domain-containing protein n=1 Tax=Flavobacterium proteolyticum TaxID=2911683 RepID=A0ABR9WQX6_9FLAO|nr:PKD-like domain-containing protein [Flavobacterium proteolyticum]MBE9576158.1 T9SS type B sorting domain-containing protein [Flavobacterium proteolyticum]
MKRILLLTMVFFSIFSYAQFPEGFEGAAFPPAGWVVEDNGVGTAQSWGRTNATGFGWVHQGTWSAMVNRDGGATSAGLAQDWLITPQVTVPANGQIRFYSRSGSNGEQGSVYKVLMSTTTQNRAAFTTTLATYTELDIQNLPFQQFFILLNAYAGQNVYFAFVMEVNNGLGDRWILDDVKVDQQCLAPTALNVTPFSTTANLSWTSPNPAGPWQIEYGPQGFVQGTGTIVNNILTNSYTLTGLSPLTSYSYYVRTICEADNVSPWSVVRNFTTTSAPPICGGNFIDSGGATGDYQNSENITTVICPTVPGELVTVTFTSFNTESGWDFLRIYDGNSTAATLLGTYSGTTLPPTFTATSASGCLTFNFTSDTSVIRSGWTANITCAPAPTCPRPTGITATSITSSSMLVSWTNNAPAATSYEVIWLPAGSPPPTLASVGQITTATSYTITGLNSQTSYDVYVRARCQPGGTDIGDWSVKGTFRTLPNYCGGDHYYDPGGPTGNYPDNVTAANGTTTICPQNPGEVVTVYFNSFNLISSINDSLTIYDGDSATGTPVGTYFGTNIIPSYTSTSPTGCLTFVFVSNGSQNAAGWDATILCGPPCPSITSVLNSSTPAAGAENVIRVCQGQTVNFTGSGIFAASGTGATYTWNFGDNTTANGQSVSHAFTNPGIYLVNLFITDANGCRNSNRINQLVYVSTTPTFSTTVSDNEICLGQSATITASATPNTFTKECAPPVSGTTFLPDGSGVSYQTSIPVDCFPFGSTITSASQITSVCINMEHSYLGDLEIRLVSPTGQSIILKAYPGGGGTYLGCPLDDPAVGPGTGRNYCFTPTATTLMVNGATTACGTPSVGSINAGNYMPVNPFTNLIGSALNGNWSLIVTDNLGIDNGYIFNWSINFDSSLIPSDYQFTPVLSSGSWTPNADITNVSGNQITVTPTTVGNHCYTYNVTDDFGCTYSRQVCLDVVPGVEFTDITVSPTQICNGGDAVYTFTGTPNAIVTYNINGGANQTITLDGTGSATLTLTGLNLTTDINVTYMTAPSVPTAGNAIAAVGGVNPNNSTGAILAAGTTANTANSTTINSSNTTVTLTLAHIVPAGTPITVSLAKNTTTGAVNIVDGPSTLLFNTGAINILQHVTFIKGTTSNTITINRANGTVFLDGVSYNYNELGCDRPLNDSASVVVYATPAVTVSPATCTADGSAIITNYNPSFTYLFSPTGPSIDSSGAILNAVFGTSYTVALDNVACTTSPSPFVIDAMLQNLPTPIINSTPPTCLADGFSTITNYDGTATYTFTPTGPSVDTTGLITGMVFGNSYTVIASNTTCDSNPSTPFSNLIMLVTPVVPTVSVTPPTCAANGFATITNYDPAITYVFTPAGPTVDASGVISGMAFSTNYEVAASNGSCTSVNSAIFTIDPILVTPAVPVISMTAPTCLADGFSTITNYDATLTYVFNPAGPTVDATGLISGMTLNTLYEVTASNATCTSAASAQFNNLVMLVTPVVPTVSVTPPTCAANGFATITNYDPAITYVFTPTGPTVDASGVISGMVLNTNYEVAASNGSCTSVNSAIFTINPILVTPAIPVISMTAPTCLADGFSTITNYDATLTYVFNPAGPTVDATGLISGMTLNTLYEVTASNATCTSVASAQFNNLVMLVTPVVPTVSVTPPTCAANGFATITNYDPAITYVFTPTGPTVDASGVISGMVLNTNYEVAASNGSCTSVNSAIFTINPILVTPAIPVISMTAPTCLADGFSTITNYDATLTYVFNPAGPTVDATGLISGMTLNTLYEVTASNATCTSVASAQFNNLVMLVTPVVPTVSITAPTCTADGFATITNYDPAITYVFTPAGPTVGTGGVISNALLNTNYQVAASNGSCTSANSSQFSVLPILPKPVLVNIVSNNAICEGTSGTITITATPNSVVTYNIDGGANQTVNINNTGTVTIATPILLSNSIYNVVYVQSTIAPFCGQNQSGSATVIVNPIPDVIITPTQTTICSGTSTSINLSSTVSGTTFTWVVVQQSNVTGASNGSGNVISQVLTSTLTGNGYVDYLVTPTSNGCVGPAQSIRINVTPRPNVTAINNNPTFCSGGVTDIQLSSNNVPGAVFSWTVTGGNVLGAAGGTGTSINQILTVSPGTTTTVEVVYTIIAEANGCSGPPQIVRVYVNPIPDLILANSTVPLCSGDSTNISFTGTVPGTVFNWVVLNSTGVFGASNGTGTSIQQVLTATSLSQGSVTYQITPTFNGCTGASQTVTVIVNPRPELFANPIHPPICSGVLSTNIFLSTFNASTVFNWTVNSVGVNGATAGSAPGPTYTIIQNLTTSVDNVAGYVDYIITPTFAGCSGTPITVRVVVNPLPKPVLTDGSICVDEFGVPFQSYTLDSGLDNANYDFVWYFNGVAIPNSNNSTYTANAVGTYGVIATNSSTNCVSSTVANMVTATVGSTVPASGLTVTQTGYFSGNATLVVNVTGGSGTLMYSLDEGTLQTSNVFTNVSAGPHKITVIDTQGCTYFTYDVFVIGYPQYFTPNGDGINDTWYIDGLQNTDVIYIFDRYGKLIKQLRGIEGWDGTYNQENLPSTDYWFTVDYLENGVKKQFKAHFALKR